MSEGAWRADAAVLAAALLFGTTFAVVRDAVADVAVVPFLAVRFCVGAAVLAPAGRRPAWCGRAWPAGWCCWPATCSRRPASSTPRRRSPPS